jgi:hypothetical protein
MSWALGRRLIILSVIAVVFFLIVSFVWYSISYEAPSCTDGKQNQDEEEVDCGGSCPYLCNTGLVPPSVEFARPVSPQTGRTDVIAYIENANPRAAARAVLFKTVLFSQQNTIIAEKEGTVDLPPSTVVPVYLPNFFSGEQAVARVFVEIDQSSFRWFRYIDERVLPEIRNTVIENTNTPRITATLRNNTANTLENVRAVITVFDERDNAIASSQTIVSLIAPFADAEAIFTWRAPFVSAPARVEVLPLLPF